MVNDAGHAAATTVLWYVIRIYYVYMYVVHTYCTYCKYSKALAVWVHDYKTYFLFQMLTYSLWFCIVVLLLNRAAMHHASGARIIHLPQYRLTVLCTLHHNSDPCLAGKKRFSLFIMTMYEYD